jgi:hypothetical protein
MKMKSFFRKKAPWIMICILLLAMVSLFGCNGKSADKLSGSANEVLTKLKEDTEKTGENILPVSEGVAINAETAQNKLGLTESEYADYVSEAYGFTALINTNAFELTMVKCKDTGAAAQVKKLISAGYDAKKWVCVYPEQSYVIDSGCYVLLYVGQENAGNVVEDKFKELAGSDIGAKDIFFKSADMADNGDAEGGITIG